MISIFHPLVATPRGIAHLVHSLTNYLALSNRDSSDNDTAVRISIVGTYPRQYSMS